MRTIYIILDSLNRHYLNCYGDSWIKTPNIDRLADKGMVFDNHYSGSLPCMPARREMLTGRVNFLEAGWGPVEPWDDCLPLLLKKQKGVYSHMITDHYHYFHAGGENYHTLFDSWEFIRGQEGDRWRPVVNPPDKPEDARGLEGPCRWGYWANQVMKDKENEEDYPSTQCFQKAMEFIDINHDSDNWHLHLEVFDPHEPFDCPKKYTDLYDDEWDEYHFTWPLYGHIDENLDGEESIDHLRRCYAGSLTMADNWLGKVLDKLDEYDMWKDTHVILTSDHGHIIGERGYWGKMVMPIYNELAHIPLIIYSPKAESGQRISNALTTTIDIMPTLMELYQGDLPEDVHGISLVHLFYRDSSHHDFVLYGGFAGDICLTDGRYTYFRQPQEGSYAYHHTMCPRGGDQYFPLKELGVEFGYFLPHANKRGIPQLRWKHESRRHIDSPEYNMIFDLSNDSGQIVPIQDPELEEALARKMKEMLIRLDAPDCQFKRLAL